MLRKLQIKNFKIWKDTGPIRMAPITLFFGSNSSGKSSIMQPLLLMKQTLESSYDPGVFFLDGPNVKFTSPQQFLHCGPDRARQPEFLVKLRMSDLATLTNHWTLSPGLTQIEIS